MLVRRKTYRSTKLSCRGRGRSKNPVSDRNKNIAGKSCSSSVVAAETARGRRQVRAGRGRATLQDRTANDHTRRADGQPPGLLRVQAVPEQRAQAGGQPNVPGQVRVAEVPGQRRGRRAAA